MFNVTFAAHRISFQLNRLFVKYRFLFAFFVSLLKDQFVNKMLLKRPKPVAVPVKLFANFYKIDWKQFQVFKIAKFKFRKQYTI